MVWKIDNPQGNESQKVKYDIVPYTRGKGLDLGCGPFKAYPHFIGVDNGHHDAQFGWQNKADVIVETCEKLDLFATQSLDFVFSSHLLEHIDDTKKALKEWFRVIRAGGYLVLYLPHKDLYPNVGEPGANPDHKHDFHPDDIIEVMKEVGGWDLIVNQDRNEENEYSFLHIYKKYTRLEHRFSCKLPTPKKKAAIVRYGGFGDMIQASSICKELKSQGYHIDFWATLKGQHILKANPHIDRFMLQDKDQVPNGELNKFWECISKDYDLFINLSESVEGSLLALPDRALHKYPKELRHQICDVNYLERTHDIAGMPHNFNAAFYPTKSEADWAKKERAKLTRDNKLLVMWSLSGSSTHKSTPWVDYVIARILIEHPNICFVLVGDHACQVLEGDSWDNEPRVNTKSGLYDIRETLTLARYCDLVVGPETGVLNAVGFENVAKVCLLSHSTVENLTKHWNNTVTLVPGNVPCYPCHTMHYGAGTCPRAKIGEVDGENVLVAHCTADISIDDIYEGIIEALQWRHQIATISA